MTFALHLNFGTKHRRGRGQADGYGYPNAPAGVCRAYGKAFGGAVWVRYPTRNTEVICANGYGRARGCGSTRRKAER